MLQHRKKARTKMEGAAKKKESFNKMNSRANSESHVFSYAA